MHTKVRDAIKKLRTFPDYHHPRSSPPPILQRSGCNAPVPPRFSRLKNFSECTFCDSLGCLLQLLLNLDRLKMGPYNFIFMWGNSPKSQGAKSNPHSPYSPDLAPCDFGLFPHMKMKLKGRRFRRSKRLKRNRRQHCGLSRKLHSEKFSSRGKRGRTGALQCRRTTWRVTIILVDNFHLNVFYGANPGTF